MVEAVTSHDRILDEVRSINIIADHNQGLSFLYSDKIKINSDPTMFESDRYIHGLT
jgi:hypothetical protein